MALTELLLVEFSRTYGNGTDPVVALAPGRVNLIGEHTDYNEGFALPMAIDRFVGVAFRPRADRRIVVSAPDFGGTASFEIGAPRAGPVGEWTNYVAGVLWALERSGHGVRGMDMVVLGDLPIGAGLSSSAAVEMAVARAACEASELEWDAVRMAEIGQVAEREYVGVSCGIMDQLASAKSAEGCALLLDCRTLDTEVVGIPPELGVVVMDTGVPRRLAESGYNERFAQCQEALREIRRAHPEIRALRDVDRELLGEFDGVLEPVVYRRVRHVVEENGRPARMAAALHARDFALAGELMNESHRSLRDLYEVSCPELDFMVDVAVSHAGSFGARLTGAGFGGSAIALVDREALPSFVADVEGRYRERFPLEARLFACRPAAGARLMDTAGRLVRRVAPADAGNSSECC
jgi:galactokinase